MKYRLISSARMKSATCFVLSLVLGAVTVAPVGAQVARSPAPIVQKRPMPSMVLLPNGSYVMTLTAAALKSKSSTTSSAPQPMELDADIVHNGSSVTVTMSDGTVLTGTGSASHLKASGPVKNSTLSIEVGGTGSSAGGTFLFAGHGTNRISGTAAMAPAPRLAAHKKSGGMGGCNSLMSCASMMWHFFAD